ncbi:ornithine aminomutase subunit alpha [Kaarinaea lacus]
MSSIERPDEFAKRRQHMQRLSDAELHNYFWELVDQIVAPLIEEARTHTSPSIERSVLLRMGFSSIEANAIVKQMGERQLLAHGAGRLILELAKSNNLSIRDSGLGLINGQYWEQLPL